MATHKDAVKRQKQSEKRRVRNRYYKKTMRSSTRLFRSLLEQGELEQAQSQMFRNVKLIQKLAQKGIIHKNLASRRVSRMYKAYNKLAQA